jgi:hypothetical protein
MLLDRTGWDVTLDAAGNWAVASDPYAPLQDVASACRTFLGEVPYDTSLGIPYFATILGRTFPASVYKSYLAREAVRVPGVTKATIYFDKLGPDRRLTGQVQCNLGVVAF